MKHTFLNITRVTTDLDGTIRQTSTKVLNNLIQPEKNCSEIKAKRELDMKEFTSSAIFETN